jgi:hypothetical protein
MDGRGKRKYLSGIHAALDRDYLPLTEIFGKVIDRTRERGASSKQ